MFFSKIIGYLYQQIPVREMWKLQTEFEKQMGNDRRRNQMECWHNFVRICDKCGLPEKDKEKMVEMGKNVDG